MSEESTEKQAERLLANILASDSLQPLLRSQIHYAHARQILVIVRNQASENKRLNDRWKELKVWAKSRIGHGDVYCLHFSELVEKMNELEAKEK